MILVINTFGGGEWGGDYKLCPQGIILALLGHAHGSFLPFIFEMIRLLDCIFFVSRMQISKE